ncbi:MAG: GT2 family glycosyltransferase [Flavobacteriales bacterium]|jgi:GT2 family glycosyltransferase
MSAAVTPTGTVGFVVIGRNEGQRLVRSLQSICQLGADMPIVYVDSGSSDNSVNFAHSIGADVVSLDMNKPFTAARARNEGWKLLLAKHANIEFVQFMDGDCQLDSQWVTNAYQHLAQHPRCAVVCGRRRETYPEATIYNTLCDIEWNTPIGEAKACGGDALIRKSALQECDGYSDMVIAGEEPEMCVRLRKLEWNIYRLDAEMTEHDANIEHFSQWWKRTKRCGFAYILGASLHGNKPEAHWVSETKRCLIWGIGFPLIALAACLISLSFLPLLILVAVYLVQYLRLCLKCPYDKAIRYQWAFFSLIGKFAEAVGAVEFLSKRLLKSELSIIEYK